MYQLNNWQDEKPPFTEDGGLMIANNKTKSNVKRRNARNGSILLHCQNRTDNQISVSCKAYNVNKQGFHKSTRFVYSRFLRLVENGGTV